MTIEFRHSALAIIAGAMAAVLAPVPPMLPSAWASAPDNLTVPDGPRAGEPWSAELTPYILEPLDMLSAESTVNEIAVRKSAQTGFTTLAIAAVGYWIDRDPARMMVIQPTDAALSDFNREKLDPAIAGSPNLKKKVSTQQSRAGAGSTTYSKKFPGGSLTLAIATSAADLRSKTVKRLIRDEIDQYPDDLDGQGDPLEISDARLMSFLASGDWKKLDISTPTILGGSKIERRFQAGDQRFWRFKCPHCEIGEFGFEWGPNFRFKTVYPHEAHYVTPCCGVVIEAHEKVGLVKAGRWVATEPGPGRFPSYHFDALSSPFVPWDETAKAYTAAGDDPNKLKAFWNLFLGLPFEIRGDAPDHVRLLERRESYPRCEVPAGGLFLTAASDVQMRGIWYEIVAWGRHRQSWVIDAGYCDGDTSSPDGEAFKLLAAATVDCTFRDAWGRERRLDALGIDSGYRSHVVYSWVRSHQRPHPETGRETVLALKGEDGWGRPALGLPRLVDIDLAGRKVKKGCRLWSVGTWPIKGAFYADVRKEGILSGQETDPEGFCHFGLWLDDVYFRQITAEYLADEKFRGRTRRVWKVRTTGADNHLLDCRVYNIALAEHLGLVRMTSDDWATLESTRGAPAETVPPLLAPADPSAVTTDVVTTSKQPDPAPPPSPVPPPPAGGWMPQRQTGWMRRT